MFNDVNGMPLHPLIIHAPVIGIPLAFLLTLLFAVPADPRLGAVAAGVDGARVHGRGLGRAGERGGVTGDEEHLPRKPGG